MSYEAPATTFVKDRNDIYSGLVPMQWQKFYAILSPPGFWSTGTLFLHIRTSPSGHARLVAIDLSGSVLHSGGKDYPSCSLHLISPGSLLNPPTEVLGESLDCKVALESYRSNVVLYPGQSDFADASHFTMRFVIKDENNAESEGLIDGWLTDDDHVLLETRRASSAPTTQPD
jgi:hypothetical protein